MAGTVDGGSVFTAHNSLVLGILLAAVMLFVSEELWVDVASMIEFVALVVTGLVTLEEAFSGFASPAETTVGPCVSLAAAQTLTAWTTHRSTDSAPGRPQPTTMAVGADHCHRGHDAGPYERRSRRGDSAANGDERRPRIDFPPSKLLVPWA